MKNRKFMKTVIFVVVLLIPIIYSFFYLKSYWNPYGDLTGMKVAVVNLDKGKDGKNQGTDFLNGLKDTGTFNICDVSIDDANLGMQNGDYYATITIPSNFSECLNSASEENKQIATITYSPNQASNYLATQIINSAVKTMELNLEEKINGEITKNLANKLEEVPSSLQTIADGSEQILNGSEDLNSGLSELNNGASTLANSYTEFNDGVNSAYEGSKTLSDGASKIDDGVNTISNGSQTLSSAIEQINNGASELSDKGNDGIAQLSNGIGELEEGVNGSNGLNTSIQSYIENVTNLENLAVSSDGTAKTLTTDMTSYMNSVNNIITALKNSDNEDVKNLVNNTLASDISNVSSKSNSLSTDTTNLLTTTGTIKAISNGLMPYNTALSQGSQKVSDGVKKLSNSATGLSQITNGISSLKIALAQVQTGTNSLNEGVNSLKSGTTVLKAGSDNLSNGLAKLSSSSGTVKSALDTLSTGANSAYTGSTSLVEGVETFNDSINDGIDDTNEELKNLNGIEEFSKNPVNFETDAYGEVGSYGVAFTPLFLCIGLWVGALMCYVVLYYDQQNRFKYLGSNAKNKFLQNALYVVIGAAQGIITGILLKIGLGFNIENIALYYFVCVLLGIVFTTIIQFLIRNFGDVGKFLALIILVLQLAASGGTFPIETIDKMFQAITPYLPMTYSIKLLREILVPTATNFKGAYIGILIAIAILMLVITYIVDFIRAKKVEKNNG